MTLVRRSAPRGGTRLLLAALGGALAVLVFWVVLRLVARATVDPARLRADPECAGEIGYVLCMSVAAVRTLVRALVTATPLAVLLSGVFLRLVGFSWVEAAVVPVAGHVLAGGLLVLVGLAVPGSIPDVVLVLLLPVGYLVAGAVPVHRRRQNGVTAVGGPV